MIQTLLSKMYLHYSTAHNQPPDIYSHEELRYANEASHVISCNLGFCPQEQVYGNDIQAQVKPNKKRTNVRVWYIKLPYYNI